MDFSISLDHLTIFEQVLTGLFLLSVLIQLFYYLLIFSKLAFFKEVEKENIDYKPVSVIISARNEDYNLKKHLPLILNQDYPEFEVVIVNHASDDDTADILNDFKREFNNLKIVNIEQDLNFFKGKKFPLSIGIKSAKNEILLLTDADCCPNSDQWIKSMTANYSSKTDIILGYGPYYKKAGLLNTLVRYDTFMIALQYFSLALAGHTYMGVGRNLSYRKSTFYGNKGFTSHYNIPSGDDDLFIREVAKKTNVKIEIAENSYMYSNPKSTFSLWLRQKQRHLSTGKVYSLKFKILLGTFSLSQLLFYITLVFLLVNNTLLPATLSFMLITISVRFFIQKKAASRLGEDQLLLFSLFGDIIYVILLPLITLVSMIRKPVNWK